MLRSVTGILFKNCPEFRLGQKLLMNPDTGMYLFYSHGYSRGQTISTKFFSIFSFRRFSMQNILTELRCFEKKNDSSVREFAHRYSGGN